MPDLHQLPTVLLYVPGDRPDRYAKAAAAAPAVILDLEDAVAPAGKPEARRAVAEHLATTADGARFWVRVGRATLEEDIAALRDAPAFGGIVLADAVPATLARLEQELPEIPVIGLVESAGALSALDNMAAAPNLVTFGIGEVDLLADLGIRRTAGTAHVIDMLRVSVVQAAAAAGLLPPVAPTSLEVRSTTTLASSTEHLRDLGFGSRTAVHPNQCAIVRAVFTPSAEEVARAADLLDRLERAGGAVATDQNGRFIDAAVVRDARATLARASHEGDTP